MPLAAEKHAEDIGLEVTDLFSHQFALVPSGAPRVAGFITLPFADRFLLHCPKLEVTALFDGRGKSIGYCLGIAVDHAGERLAVTRRLNPTAGTPGFWPAIEEFAIGLAGRWLLLVTDGDEHRILGDAGGMYNCVYDPKAGGVGSTLLMALMRNIAETDEVDYRLTLSHGMRLPFGRTRDRHARRLAVNHYLRLNDWSETRFWPGSGDMDEVEEGGEIAVVEQIRDRLSDIMAGIVTTVPAAIGVSGGNDSRNLIAAGEPVLSDVRRFYSYSHNFNSRTDYRSAVLMMRELGHKVEQHGLAEEQFTESEIAENNQRYRISTGFCVGLHALSNVNLNAAPKAGEVILTGNVMEALRAAHWKSPFPNRRNARKFGLKRCLFAGQLPFDDAFVNKWLPEYIDWLHALPRGLQARYVDVLFVEHNIPNLGAVYFGNQDNFTLCPFNDRRIVALCARLPVAYRFSNQANQDFLKVTCPELLDVPYAEDVRLELAAA